MLSWVSEVQAVMRIFIISLVHLQVIVERAKRSRVPDIDKRKWAYCSSSMLTSSATCALTLDCVIFSRYLVPADLSVAQFMSVIRKRMKLTPEQAIFFFIQNSIPPSGKCLHTCLLGSSDSMTKLRLSFIWQPLSCQLCMMSTRTKMAFFTLCTVVKTRSASVEEIHGCKACPGHG